MKAAKESELRLIEVPRGMSTAVIFGDGHKPFHDVRAWNLILKLIAEWHPTYVICLGDDADCYHWSSFTQSRYDHPGHLRSWNAGEEQAAVWAEWDRMKAASPRSHRIYTCGNHEKRVAANKRSKSPETELPGDNFVGVFKAEKWWNEIVTDDGDGIALAANGKPLMWFTHGDTAAKSALNIMEDKWGASVVFGHTHRLGVKGARTKDGKQRLFYNVPCHQILTPRYMTKPNWLQGFAFGKFFGKDEHCDIQIFPFTNHRFSFGHKVYKG